MENIQILFTFNANEDILIVEVKHFFTNITLPEKNQLDFFQAYRTAANTFGCYYMGYILEDYLHKLRICGTTNISWGSEYIETFISNCHMWKQVQLFFNDSNKESLILPWQSIDPETTLQKDIILRKEEVGIGYNGITFCKKFHHFREYYYFAPELKHHNFLENISGNINTIKNNLEKFRQDSLIAIHEYLLEKKLPHQFSILNQDWQIKA